MRKEKRGAPLPIHRQKALETPPKDVDNPQSAAAAVTSSKPFRIGLRVDHIGKYVAHSKRRIVWRFGLWNPCSDTARGQMHREEHEVCLVWSVRKRKTRLLWNGLDISDSFPPPGSDSTVQFCWKSKTECVTFQIVAHANAVPGADQYDLLVNDQSFKALPLLPQLMGWYSEVAAVADSQMNPDERDSPQPIHPANVTPGKENFGNDRKDEALQEFPGRRLMKKLKKVGVGAPTSELQDELRSDTYSPALDQLRDYLADAIPITEEKDILSRAIVNIFSQDIESSSSHDDSLSVDHDSCVDPTETEADMLYETIEWLTKHVQRRDYDIALLDFLEKKIEVVVSHVRHDRLAPLEASRIIVPVAALLGLDLKHEIDLNTIVLRGLSEATTTHDVVEKMKSFGKLDVAAVARSYHGFAICRYTSESAASRVSIIASTCDRIVIQGSIPEIYELMAVPVPMRREVSTGSYSVISDFVSPIGSDDEVHRGIPSPVQFLKWNADESTQDLSDLEVDRRNSTSTSEIDQTFSRRHSNFSDCESSEWQRMPDGEKTHRRQSATWLDTLDDAQFSPSKDASVLTFATTATSLSTFPDL